MQKRAGDHTTEPASWPAQTSRLDSRFIGALLIGCVLVALSFLNDPGGYLGTDTGGKTATLEAMTRRGDWNVDIGYWAEAADPDGIHHPLFGTGRQGDGWAQVTSVPMILAARPLWDLGGYRAALLLPVAGTVAAALAAAALAERLADRRTGTRAFWVFGLASPLVVYGLDLWEHSLGVAAIGWATVLLHDAALPRPGPPMVRAAAAGALLAAGATMRTEALVYAVVLVASVCGWSVLRRRLGAAVLLGGAAVAGFAPVWVLNRALEVSTGGNSRTDRAAGVATGTASDASGQLGVRLEEGVRTTFATAATDGWATVVVGVLLAAAVGSVVALGHRIPPDRVRLIAVALGAFTLLTVLPGLGFVPGLFAAFPVAAAGLAWNRLGPPARLFVVAAVAALPVVWAFQYIGGAGPQWGGRYVLGSAFLLGVTGTVAIGARAVPRQIAGALMVMSLVVTAFGVIWLRDRSHDVRQLFDAVVAVQEDALIARNPFFLREAGPRSLDQQWLSAAHPADLRAPADVLRRLGVDRFSVLQVEGQSAPEIPRSTVIGVDHIPALGVVFEVVHLRFEP